MPRTKGQGRLQLATTAIVKHSLTLCHSDIVGLAVAAELSILGNAAVTSAVQAILPTAVEAGAAAGAFHQQPPALARTPAQCGIRGLSRSEAHVWPLFAIAVSLAAAGAFRRKLIQPRRWCVRHA